ncbi:MAG: flagellar export protein FliJ [Candidatus Wallacebacter cryptica]|nr:flagellar export protein FliJ [Bacillota bacterium]
MARFIFRLEKVKRVRTIQESQKKSLWAQAQNALNLEKQKLTNLKAVKTETLNYGYNQVDLSLRTAVYNYLAKLDRLIEAQELAVQKAAQAETKARQIWLLARQEKEKLERLEEKHYEEYVQEELRAEQKLLDDMKNNAAQI